MDTNITRMSEQLKKNPAMLQSLMQSRDGQELLRMLNNTNGANLQQAAQSAARGDPTKMMQMVQQLMQSPDGAALMQRISQAIQKP